jgi:hypothetical protein
MSQRTLIHGFGCGRFASHWLRQYEPAPKLVWDTRDVFKTEVAQ